LNPSAFIESACFYEIIAHYIGEGETAMNPIRFSAVTFPGGISPKTMHAKPRTVVFNTGPQKGQDITYFHYQLEDLKSPAKDPGTMRLMDGGYQLLATVSVKPTIKQRATFKEVTGYVAQDIDPK
jgi:hypothetical protein